MAKLISIVGPTGVGKTACAMHLAQRLHCPIISADSVQIYRGLDIGSGKATSEEQALVTHHQLDIIAPDEHYDAGAFATDCDRLLGELFQSHENVLLVGGTGLYFKAIWDGFDAMPAVPEAVRLALNALFAAEGLPALQAELAQVDPATWAVIDQKNPARIIRALEVYRASGIPISEFRKGEKVRNNPWEDVKIGLTLPRETLYARIDARVDQMMADGFVAETASLFARYGPDCNGLQSLGYQELVQYLQGAMALDAAVDLIKRNTRRYAKRQWTWFNHVADVTWFAPDAFAEIDAWRMRAAAH